MRGNRTGLQRLLSNLRDDMLQSHEPEGLGNDTLKHVAALQIQRLALVEQHALGIRFHALYNDVGSPGGIRFLYAELNQHCQDWIRSIYEVGLHASARASFGGHPAEQLESCLQQP